MDAQIQDFLEYCRFQLGLAPLSIRGYQIDLRLFHEFLKSSDYLADSEKTVEIFQDVDRRVLEKYVAYLSPKYKVKTIKRKIACISSLFTYLESRDLIEENPFHKFKLKLKEGYRAPASLTVEEMGKFLQAVYEDKADNFFWQRDAAIIELLFASGLRVAELCGLKFGDYDQRGNSLHIIGKGNRERLLYLTNPEVLTVFHNYLDLRQTIETDHDYIFITRFREKMSTQAVRNLITKYTHLAGINKNVTPHVFRHSFASLLLESGVDIKYIQEFMGHSNISTTQIYLHTSEEEKKRILTDKHPRGRVEVVDTN